MSRNSKRTTFIKMFFVAPREGRVSRNGMGVEQNGALGVAPREGRVSRNLDVRAKRHLMDVAPREGRVSRNAKENN